MHFIESLKLAFDAIWSHKLRSFLTLLGVIFGVATVIVVVSLIEGFNKYVDEKIANIGTNAFSVQKFSIEDFASLDAYEQARKRNKDVTMDDLEGLRQARTSTIKAVGGQEQDMCELKYAKKVLFGVSLRGITANMVEIQNKDLTEGRSFLPAEELGARAVCFIGADIAEEFFPGRTPLGEWIKIDGRPFEIVGVAKATGSVFGQSQDKYVSIPLTTFMSIYGSRRSIQLVISSTSETNYQDAVDEARVMMRTRRRLNPSEPDNFGIITPTAINNLRDKIFGTVQTVAIGVTSIALIVGGIVIMNIMLVSVTERTKEIGIRKSLGARRQDIIKQFLAESVTLAFVGGAMGVAIAYGLSKLVSTLTPIPTSLPLLAVGVALLVSSSVGLIAGVYPAWRAAGLDPIQAMRSD
jgi:putative ABC transport system permease protein